MNRALSMSAVACVAAASGVALAAPASAATTHFVTAGHSIQAAVNRAHPGDTIIVKPGIYRESVFVRTDNLTIRGSGAAWNGTVLQPGKKDPKNPCSTEDGGNGICVIGSKRHYVQKTHISQLLVRNYHGNGIIGVYTNGLSVEHVTAANNGEYGIARFESTWSHIIKNAAYGSGEAGIYSGDSPHNSGEIIGNDVWDNGIGIFYRHSRGAFIGYNNAYGNCIGILALNAGQPPAFVGNAAIWNNSVKNNNKFCPPSDEAPPTQGGGIVLVGATGMTVSHNAVLGNRGKSFGSGGIVLLNGTMFGGGPSSGNTIENNTAYRNGPADIVTKGGGHNVYRHNFCASPDRLCR